MKRYGDYIGFRDSLKEKVEILTLNGQFVASGELSFGSGALLEIKLSEDKYIAELDCQDALICKGKHKSFTVFGCDLQNGNVSQLIYAQALVDKQLIEGRFTKISILSSDISKWMCNTSSGKILDGQVVKEIDGETFKVNITDHKQRDIIVSSENWTQSKTTINKTEISEDFAITFEIKRGYFTYQDIMLLSKDTSSLFSLLIGHSVSIDYVFERSDKIKRSVYFNNNSTDSVTFKNHFECFTHSSWLFSEQKWDVIFKNFYEYKYDFFDNIWTFYSGMMTYDSFWDYEIFGYMSILDQYVERRSKNNKARLSKEDVNTIRSDLNEALDSSVQKLSESNAQVIETIRQTINNLSGSSTTTYAGKYDYVKNASNAHVVNAIGLDDEYFKHMRKLRDAIAHGAKRKLSDESNITYEMNGLAKIKLLLMYWCFCDMGFSDEEYLLVLDRAHLNSVVRQARLNKSVIHKALGTHNFISLDESDFEKVKTEGFWHIVLEYDEGENKYGFHREATKAAKNMSGKHRSVQMEISESVNDQKIKTIDYVGNIYLENQGEVQELHCSYILNGLSHSIVGFSENGRFVNNSGNWESAKIDH